jgi:hypothetical protein
MKKKMLMWAFEKLAHFKSVRNKLDPESHER